VGSPGYKAAGCAEPDQEGATVQVVMTEAAAPFITPVTMAGPVQPAGVQLPVGQREPNNMPHINLSRDADAILVAPCSADSWPSCCTGGPTSCSA